MKAFEVDTTSLHFRFNRWWIKTKNHRSDMSVGEAERLIQDVAKDFCTYWRMTIKHVIRSIFVTIFAMMVAIAIFILGSNLWGFMWDFSWDAMFNVLKAIGGAIVFLLIMGVIIALLNLLINGVMITLRRLDDRFDISSSFRSNQKPEPAPKPKKEPGLLVTKYKSWKGKYCPMVEYK